MIEDTPLRSPPLKRKEKRGERSLSRGKQPQTAKDIRTSSR